MLAPVARTDRMTSATLQKTKDNENARAFIKSLGPEIMPSPQIDGKISSGFFKVTGLANFGVGLISDDDPNAISQKAMETYLGHFPAGTSFRCVDHFRQMTLAKQFQRYDYGLEENVIKYEQETPPAFDLSAIKKAPIALFCGSLDQLASPEDYKWLRDQLINTDSLVYFKEFKLGHMGLLMPPNNNHFFEIL